MGQPRTTREVLCLYALHGPLATRSQLRTKHNLAVVAEETALHEDGEVIEVEQSCWMVGTKTSEASGSLSILKSGKNALICHIEMHRESNPAESEYITDCTLTEGSRGVPLSPCAEHFLHLVSPVQQVSVCPDGVEDLP